MNLFKIKLYGLLCLSFILCSCTSVVFPETVDENSATPGIIEGKSLGSDQANISYDDEKDMNKYAEKITPAKTIPVRREAVEPTVVAKAPVEEKTPLIIAKDADVANPNDNIVVEPTNYVPSMNFLADTLYFRNGSSFVGQEHSAQIKKVAKLVKQHNATVTVYGYASSRTRNTDIVNHKLANFKVSMERAENTAKALRRAGVPAKNIKIEALSDTNPAYLEVMPEGERLNRRAEIYVSY